MRDDHTHCPCNGVWLCRSCHSDVHTHPFEAKQTGFIVPRSVSDPGALPVQAWYGNVDLHCGGYYTFHVQEAE